MRRPAGLPAKAPFSQEIEDGFARRPRTRIDEDEVTRATVVKQRTEALDEGRIDEVVACLAQNRPVRRKLPDQGQLHIDRKLPFLFVYRQPPSLEDAGTERLIRAEASFLIAPGEPTHRRWVAALVRRIASTLAEEFGAFLLIEISGLQDAETGFDADWCPHFRVTVPSSAPPDGVIESFEKHLTKIRIFQKSSSVDVVRVSKLAPGGLPPLLNTRDAKELNCSLLGLEVLPIYRDAESGVFPLAVRTLRRQLSRALRRTAHQFSLSSTTHSPASYLALGRRTLLKAALEVDRRLSEVSDSFDFLLHVTPVNVEAAWRQFKAGGCDKAPAFVYRPLPVDPILLKRTLMGIPMERIADPAIEQLFRDKQIELDRKLTMFLDRGTTRFFHGSQQLYGKVSDDLVALAGEILDRVPPAVAGESGGRLGAAEFARRARAEVERYRKIDPEFCASVTVRDDVFSVMVSGDELFVGRRSAVSSSRVKALLQHEVGTHLLTYFNGRSQPLRILYNGLAGYDELQEGLAVLSEHLVGGLTPDRLRILAARVIASRCLIDGASFVETFRELISRCGFERRRAFNIAMRIHRGGGLTKDAVYLRGLVGILEYLKDGKSLDPLFVGKIARPYLAVLHELRVRRVLNPPRLRPRYLDTPESRDRLERLRRGVSVLELTEKSGRE